MKEQDRRRFLKAGGLVAISAIVPSLGCDRNEVNFKSMPLAPEMPDDVPSPDDPATELPQPPITSNARFYLQSIKGKDYDPKLSAEDWSLRVDGLVENPLRDLSYEDIRSMPMVELNMTMQCIGNWIGGPLVGNARWGGTPFKNLLNRAGVKSEAIRVKFESVDGYVTSIPLDLALRDEVLLVWEMNGQVLPSKHGFPLRLINLGYYGQKMPKWISRIELIDDPDHRGHWESMPVNKSYKWSDAAIATVNSRIDAPFSLWDDVKDPANGGVTRSFQTIRGTAETAFVIHGIAMAGERQVERVDVSTDSGSTWEEAHITTQSLPNQWVRWRYDWTLPPTGRYEILARAWDSAGDTQPEKDEGVDLYDGRTGWHRVPVDVERTDG